MTLQQKGRLIGGSGGTRVSHFKLSSGGHPLGGYDLRDDYKVTGTQFTESEGHPFRFSKQKGRNDLGGPFYTQKAIVLPFGEVHRGYENISGGFEREYRYSGPLLPVNPSTILWPPDNVSSQSDLDAAGATAISRVKPTNPVAGLTAALAELKTDGLPHVESSVDWTDKATLASGAGEDYLNVQFGWVPFVSDVSSFASGVTHARAVIEQYKRGIGRPTRRTYHFPAKKSTSETIIGTGFPWGPQTGEFVSRGSGTPKAGLLSFQDDVVQERWFSGAFTYYFPSDILGSSKLADYAILAKQLGLEITPSVLWQVTPWSWAVDWFSNMGDVISNWSAFHEDGLVLLYGYMMEHTIVTRTFSLRGVTDSLGDPIEVPDLTAVVETKVRSAANPYGFGVSWDGLSLFQTSILGALGLTKGNR